VGNGAAGALGITQETLALAKQALSAGMRPEDMSDPLRKAITQASGLVAFNLEAPSKKLFPVLTPFRNKIPRDTGGKGTAVQWKAVTKINATGVSAGVSEGNRGAVISTTTQSLTAAYKGLGLEDYVTYEAEYAGRTFEDAKALAVMNLLSALMIAEESVIIGGNASTGLGTTPTPTVANSGTGGTIAAATYDVIAVALTTEGWTNSAVGVSGVPVGPISRTNADGTIDVIGVGVAQKSAASSGTTTSGSTSSITASVTPVPRAVAYAWYVGTSGAERIVAITGGNSVLITALPGGTNQLASALPSSDQSTNTLVFDGIIPQVIGPGALTTYQAVGSSATLFQGSTGGLVMQMATGVAGTGTPLTADGKGGIVEWDAMLRAFWDLSRLSPVRIWVNAQEAQNAATKVLTASGSGVQRFIQTTVDGVTGGVYLKSYYNKFGTGGGQVIDIALHPNLPPGTTLFETEQLPYRANNVPSVLRMDIRQEYYQIEWSPRTRKYEYGEYVDEVLKCYFPGAFGVVMNVANG